ncbi:MAG: YjjG family noncanonical pyrimidine nucleotidase [Longicatena sp.]|nr:YjjG family noncanonical pyrimidine nucleotidase [Longicatena sp.]
MKRYRTLIFDADQTLLDFKKNEAHALPAVFQKYHIELSEEIKNTYLAINAKLWRMLEQGQLTTKQVMLQRFEILFERFDIQVNPQTFSDDYMELLSQGAYLMDDALDILALLSQQYRCVILTNGFTQSQTYRLQHSGVAKYMEHIFISEQIGHRKPSIQLAKYVLDKLQCEASECLMIGDCFETDMQFGINAGMDTCWIRTQNDFDERTSQVTYHINDIKDLGGLLK